MQNAAYDEIRIEELEIFARHGVFLEEKEKGQPFYINAVLYMDLRPAGLKDDLTLSTHYGEVSLFIGKWLTEHTYNLLETAAEITAQEVLLHFPLIRSIALEIRKPKAPIPMKFESVSVKIHRGWHRAYIAFGSNLGESEVYIDKALAALSGDCLIKELKSSDRIRTKPYGSVEQADFLNGVVCILTLYTPTELLHRLHELEQAAGRERKVRWGPRTLDLDIIFYDKLVYEDEALAIPHADMQNRDFVLQPMAQLAPYFRHPLLHKTMTQLLSELEERENKWEKRQKPDWD